MTLGHLYIYGDRTLSLSHFVSRRSSWCFSRYWIYEAVTDRILFIDLWFSLSFSTGLFEEIVSDSTLYATSTCLGNRVRADVARYRASRWSRTKVLPLRLLSQVYTPRVLRPGRFWNVCSSCLPPLSRQISSPLFFHSTKATDQAALFTLNFTSTLAWPAAQIDPYKTHVSKAEGYKPLFVIVRIISTLSRFVC